MLSAHTVGPANDAGFSAIKTHPGVKGRHLFVVEHGRRLNVESRLETKHVCVLLGCEGRHGR